MVASYRGCNCATFAFFDLGCPNFDLGYHFFDLGCILDFPAIFNAMAIACFLGLVFDSAFMLAAIPGLVLARGPLTKGMIAISFSIVFLLQF